MWQEYKNANSNRDSGVQWAYVLNRIQHDKFREARAEIDGLIPAGRDAWEQRYAQIWLKMLVGEVNSALLDMQDLKSRIVANVTLDDTTKFRLYTRLGKMYGYAEGPASIKATPSTLHDTLAILVDGLNDVDFGNFEDNRKQVSKKYVDLLNEKSATVASKIQDQKQNNAARTAKIDADNAQADVRQRELLDQATTLRTQMAEDANQLRQSLRPLESDLSRIDSQIRRSDFRLLDLHNDIARRQRLAFGQDDRFRRSRFLNQAGVLRRELYIEQDLRNVLQGEYNQTLAQIDLIKGQIIDVERAFRSQIALREQESKQLVGQQKRNLRELKKLQNPDKPKGYVREITARTGYLPTYDPFPTDEFRREALK